MKVLFLGNSHTYYNDMPQIFADICKERGKDVEVAMQAQSGVTYKWHYSHLVELRFALMHGGFDYIVMQQAAHPGPSKEETLRDAAKIIALARRFGVTPIQTVPWAEKRDPAHQSQMYDIFDTVAKENDIKLNPVGRVFEDIFYNHPDINMYWVDGEHASAYGSYAAALSAYATIFGESVKGISPHSYYTYPVSEENWALVENAYAVARENPDTPELMKEADRMWAKYAVAVLDKEEAKATLDPDKAAIIQDLVDKYAL